MVALNAKSQDLARLAGATGLCLAIFLLDSAASPERGFAQAFPLVLLMFYGVRSRWLPWAGLAIVAIFAFSGLWRLSTGPGWLAAAEGRIILVIVSSVLVIALE